MSLSPTTSTSNYDDQPNGKRRRTTSFNTSFNGARSDMASPQDSASAAANALSGSAHIPKRGARACTNCRKGKNRCEGEASPYTLLFLLPPDLAVHAPAPSARPPARPGHQAPCRRCQLSGAQCVFEKPEKKAVQALSTASVE